MALVNFVKAFRDNKLSEDGFLIKVGVDYAYAVNGMNPANRGLGMDINFNGAVQK